MPRVSVLMSAYNSDKYIAESIESILNQTFKDFEFVIINDGSTDKSREILEKFAKEDTRFKVINKEHGGVSSARNIGIEKSEGEYIQFVDGDDWIEPNCLEECFNKINEKNVDFVF